MLGLYGQVKYAQYHGVRIPVASSRQKVPVEVESQYQETHIILVGTGALGIILLHVLCWLGGVWLCIVGRLVILGIALGGDSAYVYAITKNTHPRDIGRRNGLLLGLELAPFRLWLWHYFFGARGWFL